MLAKFVDKFKKINIYQIALVFFILCLLAVNIRWLKWNTAPPAWDQSGYLENSQVMYHALTERGLAGFGKAYTIAFWGVSAPLFSLLPIPFYLIFGNTTKVVYIPNLIFLILFNVYLFKLVNLLTKNRAAALLACLFSSTFPLLIAGSRDILVEYFTTTMTVIFIYYLLLNKNFQNKKYNVLLGALLGFGLLFKALFPLYIALPTLYILYLALKEKRNFYDKTIWKSVGLILAVGGFLAATWYYKNILYVAHFAYLASFGAMAKDYSMQVKNFSLLFINYGLSVYYSVLLVLAGFIFLIKKIKGKEKIFSFNFWLLLFWFLPTVIYFIATNKTLRFLTPFIPVFGIALAIFLAQILPKATKIVLPVAALLLVFPTYNLLYSSFKSVPGKDINWGQFVLTRKYEFLSESGNLVLAPPNNEIWPIEEIVDFIYKDSIWQEESFLVFVTPGIKEFNLNNFRYYAALKNYKLLNILGLPWDSLSSALAQLKEGQYIVTEIGGRPNRETYIYKYNPEIQQILDEEKLPYKKIKTFDLPDGSKAAVYKKSL